MLFKGNKKCLIVVLTILDAAPRLISRHFLLSFCIEYHHKKSEFLEQRNQITLEQIHLLKDGDKNELVTERKAETVLQEIKRLEIAAVIEQKVETFQSEKENQGKALAVK